MKLIPLNKQSKKEQKKYHARSLRDWNGLKPTTRVIKSKKYTTEINCRNRISNRIDKEVKCYG